MHTHTTILWRENEMNRERTKKKGKSSCKVVYRNQEHTFTRLKEFSLSFVLRLLYSCLLNLVVADEKCTTFSCLPANQKKNKTNRKKVERSALRIVFMLKHSLLNNVQFFATFSKFSVEKSNSDSKLPYLNAHFFINFIFGNLF